MTYRLNETSGHGSMVTINVPSLHRCAEMCRGMLCWVQCKAALVAVRSFDGCSAELCWVRCKAVLGVVQKCVGAVESCDGRPAGAEVMLKSSLTVSVVGEAPKDARLHTRSCTYTEKRALEAACNL